MRVAQKQHTDRTLKEVDGLTQKVDKLNAELEEQARDSAEIVADSAEMRASSRLSSRSRREMPPRSRGGCIAGTHGRDACARCGSGGLQVRGVRGAATLL